MNIRRLFAIIFSIIIGTYLFIGILFSAPMMLNHSDEYRGGVPNIIKDITLGWGLILVCNQFTDHSGKTGKIADMFNPAITTKLWTVDTCCRGNIGHFESFWTRIEANKYALAMFDEWPSITIRNEWTNKTEVLKDEGWE